MKNNRPLFTIPPTEHYHLVQHDLRQIENKMIPVIQRLIKKLYPALLSLIPKDVKKSQNDDDDEDVVSYDIGDIDDEMNIKQLQSMMGTAMLGGIYLGGSELWDKLRMKRSISTQDFDHAFNIDEIWSTNNNALLERSRMTMRNVADTLSYDARLYIKRALGEGLTYKEMSSGLKDLIGYDDSWRAVRVARTEANWAANQGIANAAKSLGIEKYTVNLSPSACENCQDDFIGVTLTQDEIDSALPKHPNCNCTAIPIIPDDWTIEDYM